MKEVIIKSPASIANLVCGFDILGMALEEPNDEMRLRLTDNGKIKITHTDSYGLSEICEENVAGVALLAMLHQLQDQTGFDITIQKNIKPGSGLGSSAASAAGAVMGANRLLGDIFTKEQLVSFAMAGEKLASGVKHADNISPCIYGGITLIRSIYPLDIIPIPSPDIYITVVHPQVEVKTADARQILRKQVLLKDAIKQWGNIAGLVAGLFQNDLSLIGRSMEDAIVEPIRSMLIPAFDEVKQVSLSIGAIGGGIAGSGPSIFMISSERPTALKVEEQLQLIYNRIGLPCKTYVTTINNKGVQIINHE